MMADNVVVTAALILAALSGRDFQAGRSGRALILYLLAGLISGIALHLAGAQP